MARSASDGGRAPGGGGRRSSPGRSHSPARFLIILLAGITLAAAYLRARFEARKPPAVVPLIVRVRTQLALPPVLAAEEALRRDPHDAQARLRLAGACARTGDPAGAALALYPLVDRIDRMSGKSHLVNPVDPVREKSIAQFVGYCAQLGWLDEGLAALRHLPVREIGAGAREAARARLALAAASAARGERARAVALLAALEREAGEPRFGREADSGGGRAPGAALGMDEWLDGAMTWYQCRRPDRAVAWARQGVARAPSPLHAGDRQVANSAARAVLARCLLAAGQPEAALQALPAAPDGTADPLTEYWRARAALRCRDAARRGAGRATLGQFATRDPPDPVAAFEAGRADLRARQAGPALTLLSAAARSGYQGVLTHELLAEAYAALGRASAAAWAQGRAQRFRGRLAAAEASLRRSLEVGTAPPGAYQELGQVLLLRGQPRAALDVLQRARQAYPGDLDLALGEADALNALDRFAEQARTLEAAAALVPERAHEPLRNLGKMFYETRQFDRMIPVLERAVQSEPEDAVAHRYLGLCYAMRPEDPAQAEKGVAHLLRATAIAPDDSVPWTSAGAVLQRIGALPEAAACYRRAIDGESGASGPYFSLGQALQRQGRPVEAALLLKLFRARRDLAAWHAEWERRINADRGDAAAHYAMGDLLLRSDGPRSAYPYLLIAASLRPQWRQAQERLADTCALLDYLDLWQDAEHAAR